MPRSLRERVLDLMAEPDTNWTVGEIRARLPDVTAKSSVGACLSRMRGDVVPDGSRNGATAWRLASASPSRIRRAPDSVPGGYPVAPVEEVDNDTGEHQRWVEALSAIARPDEGLSDALERAIDAVTEADEHVEPENAGEASDLLWDVDVHLDLLVAEEDWTPRLHKSKRDAILSRYEFRAPALAAIDTPPPGWAWSGSRWEPTEPVDLDAIIEQAQRVVEARTAMERERRALARMYGVLVSR